MPSGSSLYVSSRPWRSWCMSIVNGEQVMQHGIYRLADYFFEWFMLMLIQSQLPEGATLLGMLIYLDKTNILVMTRDWVTHPLLISLTDIIMDFWTNVILPIPMFLHKNKKIWGVLENCLIHKCIDFVVKPLKKAAEIWIMMSDPLSWHQYCFTPLVGATVDTPEALMYAGISKSASPVTTAIYKQFGDPYCHEPWMAHTITTQLTDIEMICDPWYFTLYLPEAKWLQLNRVHQPFWWDWPLMEPSLFLTPEPLHHWHKTVGGTEIDFCFSILQPHVGFHHFAEGISNLEQVIGCDHCDVQPYTVGVITGAIPQDFLIAIWSVMDFRYHCQATELDDKDCENISAALCSFINTSWQ